MTDRSVIRFAATDIQYIADILRGAYAILNASDDLRGGEDSSAKLFLGDFIEALETDDCIEIVDDEDMLIVED